jgi:hypothetical protein
MAAAVVAGVAGAAAVVTAAALPALIAGLASALVAMLVLVEDPDADGPSDGDRTPPPVALDATAPDPLGADEDVDPLRELFESGPPAGGSGLLGAEFVLTTLRGRMAVARRALRPLAVVCFEAHETGAGGVVGAPVPTDDVATVLRRTLREADVSGHLEDHAYVCILEDTGEDGAVWTAERVRRSLTEGGRTRRFRAGVAAYPAHGLEPEELEAKAREALAAARDWATDRIEVAGAP